MTAVILVVEDDPASLELATYLLECAGYPTLAAANGVEGLQTALRERPDLIVSDLQMPVLDGCGLAQQLRASRAWQRVPLVALSALSMRDDRERALAAGFDAFLPKPLNPRTFAQEVSALLPPALRAPG